MAATCFKKVGTGQQKAGKVMVLKINSWRNIIPSRVSNITRWNKSTLERQGLSEVNI